MYILFVIYSLFNIICTSVYILFITMLLYRLDHRLYIYIYIYMYKNNLEFFVSYMPNVFTEFKNSYLT